MIKFYSIYDNQLHQSNPPFAAADDKSAIRMVRNMLLSADDSIYNRVRSICDLRFVGTFDEVTARFESKDDSRVLCSLDSIPMPSDIGGDSN